VSKILGSLAELLPHSWRKYNGLASWSTGTQALWAKTGASSKQRREDGPRSLAEREIVRFARVRHELADPPGKNAKKAALC
jgi:hypothetical protein